MGIKLVDIYSRLVEFYSKKPTSNKEISELKEKYSELEKKVDVFDKILTEKEKDLQAKNTEIRNLTNLVDYYKHSSAQNSYSKPKRSYFNLGLSGKLGGLYDWFGEKKNSLSSWLSEKKESFADWFKEDGLLYTLGGAALAGLIGASIYLNFYDYVAAGGIGLATSGLICGTFGALHDYLNARGHDNVYPASIFGSIGGVIAGPISYALFNFWENTGNVDWFNNIQGFPDLLAKSMLGGVAASAALLALIVLANSKN